MAASALMARLTRRWRKRSVDITEEDPTFKTVYLGNTVTQWAKGSGSVDKPLATLWRNYCQSTKPDIEMRVTIAVSGLKATTREHGLTEYWSHRITNAYAHPSYPKMFCWVYRHEGRKMKPELRCHAVLCSSEAKARLMERHLTERLHQALVEFRKEKQLRQNARLSVVSVLYPGAPRRKVVLTNGGANYRPPLERSKSAPKLSSIEEDRLGEEAAAREPAPRRRLPPPLAALVEEEEPLTATPRRQRAFSEPTEPPPDVSCHPQPADAEPEPPAPVPEPLKPEERLEGLLQPLHELLEESLGEPMTEPLRQSMVQPDDSDTASEHSAASVPSDPTGGDSDCETLVLETGPGQCRVYRVDPRRLAARGPERPPEPCELDDLVRFGHAWAKPREEDTTSDESGYSEEPLKGE